MFHIRWSFGWFWIYKLYLCECKPVHGRHDLVRVIALFEDNMNRNHRGAVFIRVSVLHQSFLYLGFTALLPDHHHAHAIVSRTAFTCRSSVQSHVIAVWNCMKWILLLVFHWNIPTLTLKKPYTNVWWHSCMFKHATHVDKKLPLLSV
jgi:hypothetical protein